MENVRVMNVLAKVVHHLYNCDILDEQVITQWYYTQPESVEVEEHQQVRRQVSAQCIGLDCVVCVLFCVECVLRVCACTCVCV